MLIHQTTKTEFTIQLNETEEMLIDEISENSGRDAVDELNEIFVKGIAAAGLELLNQLEKDRE